MSESIVRINGPKSRALSRTKKHSTARYTVVKIEWRDYGTPLIDADFWIALVEDLLEASADKEIDVLVMCQGGHGRTGTALAILAVLLGHVPVGACPVEWVRENYCDEAVESNSQLNYIEAITGWECRATAAGYSGTTYSYGTGTTTTPRATTVKPTPTLADYQNAKAYGMTIEEYMELPEAEDDSLPFGVDGADADDPDVTGKITVYEGRDVKVYDSWDDYERSTGMYKSKHRVTKHGEGWGDD